MTWYVRTANREFGPLSEQALRAIAATGQIDVKTLVRRSVTEEWVSIATVPGILPPARQDLRCLGPHPRHPRYGLNQRRGRRRHSPYYPTRRPRAYAAAFIHAAVNPWSDPRGPAHSR